MAFLKVDPGAMFGGAVEAIWDWRVGHREFCLERRLPTPGTGIIINLAEDQTRVYGDDAERRCEYAGGTVFDGQYTRSFLIDSAEQTAVMGVIFRPGGAAHFFREPMQRLANRHVELGDFAGPSAAALRERLLHTRAAEARVGLLVAWLQQRYRADTLHPVARAALACLTADPALQRIDSLITASGYSARRFSTLFEQAVGIGAKRFARLTRFRNVIDAVTQGHRVEWTRVAVDCGFHDQPHLVREFRAFAGMTPTAYVATRGSMVNHVAIDPS